MKIKFCGLRRPEDIAAVNELKPDFAGFILAKGFKRMITYEKAEELGRAVDPGIKKVGVFVNDDTETVADLVNKGIIDLPQLHGDEDEEYIAKLRTLCEAQIIKAFKIRTAEDVSMAEASSADHILLDAGTGEGKTFEWQLIKELKRPYILAGGLGPDNIAQALSTLHPWGVDVSSGIETNGYKDPEKMKEFINGLLPHRGEGACEAGG